MAGTSLGGRVAAVVSTWEGSPPEYLRTLLASLDRHSPGHPFDLYLSANGEAFRPEPETAGRFAEVFVLENVGYNRGAWDHAWRRLAGHDRFLFLQDDCFALRPGWLADFVRRFAGRTSCGLVGEQIQRSWDRPWSEMEEVRPRRLGQKRVSAELVRRARRYREILERWGIPPGATARHLTTVVHFTSRAVLEEVDGYEIASDYEEAIAAEIGFSRKLEAHGLELVQIGRRRHTRIGHREWPADGLLARMRNSLRKRF